jgi:DNA-binding Lrp family transcriptional regulator
LTAERHQRRWTPKEDQFLLENVGHHSFEYIAKKLGRTPKAVERRLTRLGALNVKREGGWLSGHQLAQALGVDEHVIYRWRDQHGLPLKKKKLHYSKKRIKTPHYYISVEEFWKWAENHKDKFNATKVDTDWLLPVPEWFHEKYKQDLEIPKRKGQYWTEEEDNKLWTMFYDMNMKQKEIAVLLHRSKDAVEKRLGRLRKLKGIS